MTGGAAALGNAPPPGRHERIDDILDQVIAIRQGDVIVFKLAHHVEIAHLNHIKQVIARKLDPHGIGWLVVDPDIDVTVMRPEESFDERQRA